MQSYQDYVNSVLRDIKKGNDSGKILVYNPEDGRMTETRDPDRRVQYRGEDFKHGH